MDAPPRWSRIDPDTQTMDNVACSTMGEAVCRLFFLSCVSDSDQGASEESVCLGMRIPSCRWCLNQGKSTNPIFSDSEDSP